VSYDHKKAPPRDSERSTPGELKLLGRATASSSLASRKARRRKVLTQNHRWLRPADESAPPTRAAAPITR
jgi:hypothetical protein